jgi:hypothetical protein
MPATRRTLGLPLGALCDRVDSAAAPVEVAAVAGTAAAPPLPPPALARSDERGERDRPLRRFSLATPVANAGTPMPFTAACGRCRLPRTADALPRDELRDLGPSAEVPAAPEAATPPPPPTRPCSSLASLRPWPWPRSCDTPKPPTLCAYASARWRDSAAAACDACSCSAADVGLCLCSGGDVGDDTCDRKAISARERDAPPLPLGVGGRHAPPSCCGDWPAGLRLSGCRRARRRYTPKDTGPRRMSCATSRAVCSDARRQTHTHKCTQIPTHIHAKTGTRTSAKNNNR